MKSAGAEAVEKLTHEHPRSAWGRPDSMTGRAGGGLLIDPALEAKALTDSAYKEFIRAVSSACESPDAQLLKIAECRLDEKRDLERPAWLNLILHVDFIGGDFGNKRGRRIKLRQILDERIDAAGCGSGANGRTAELAERFFITMGW